tara:strand:- start:752 stop:1480 length:729 start_codon:yes stop_codon:yes gene_type:complete
MTYHIFSGLYTDGGTFQNGTGIGLWCNYDNAANDYTTNSLTSFVISTPNFPDNTSIGGGLTLNGELCGSAPIQYTGVNSQFAGPADGVGTTPFPNGKSRFALGAVDLPEYTSNGGTLGPSDWDDYFRNVGFRGNGSTLTVSKLPGQVIPSTDHYNVIVAANTDLGSTQGDSGGRVHWDVAVGTLGQFVSKMLGQKLGRVNGPSLGTVTSATPDELAAGIMLLSGYGILKNDALAFASQPAPA